MKKREQKKLKLTKLTVDNLERVKGGDDPCACHVTTYDGAFNQNHTGNPCVATGPGCDI